MMSANSGNIKLLERASRQYAHDTLSFWDISVDDETTIGCGHTRILSRYNLNCFTFLKFISNTGKYGVITIRRYPVTLCSVSFTSFAKLPVLWLIILARK